MRFAAYAALLLTVILWSGNWIVGRAVRNDMSPALATLGRMAIVIVSVAPFALAGLRERLRSLSGDEWRVLLIAGITGGGPHLAMQWLGLQYTTATSATLMTSTAPIFILLLASVFLAERIRALQWLGIAVSFTGVAVIASSGDLAALATLSLNRGDLLAVGSMLLFAAYTVALKRRRDALSTTQFFLVISCVGAIALLPWVGWELTHDARAGLSRNGILAFLYSGLGSFLLANLGWNYAVRRIGASRTGVWMHLMPGFAVVLATLFLAEYPHWFHFAGIALIIAGVRASSVSSSR
jgi:drug/metabolite transporter (DMT)-like permease